MKMITLRSFCLATAALALALPAGAEVKIPDEYKTGGFAIGCQAYSFNQYSVFEAIEKTAQAGGKVIEFYPGQRMGKDKADGNLDHNSSDEVLTKVKAKLAEHKIKAVNYGVVGIPNNEAGARKIFEFAKKMGLRAVTTESTESIDVIEKLVKEYDIMVGYHNHPKRVKQDGTVDPGYKVWDPNYIKELTANRDPRIGSAADTGHWARSGVNAVEALKILKGRIISSHLKDLNEFGKPGAHDMPYGTGTGNIKGVLDELKAQNFQGNISIEYEYHWTTSVPEITQCIDFVRNYGK